MRSGVIVRYPLRFIRRLAFSVIFVVPCLQGQRGTRKSWLALVFSFHLYGKRKQDQTGISGAAVRLLMYARAASGQVWRRAHAQPTLRPKCMERMKRRYSF